MAMTYGSFLDNINKIAKQYNTSINPELEANLSNIYNINKKYQLSPGTEKDFNNAVTFFFYSVLKNSKLLDGAENYMSQTFKKYLMDYYEKDITNDELGNLIDYIYTYNNDIYNKFSFKDASTKLDVERNIFSEIFFINPSTLEMSQDSYAYNLLLNIQKFYLTEYKKIDGADQSSYVFTNEEIHFLLILLFLFLYNELIKYENNKTDIENINDTSDSFFSFNIDYIGDKQNTYNYTYNNIEYSESFSTKQYYYSANIENPLSIGSDDQYLNIYLLSYEDEILDVNLNISTEANAIFTDGFAITETDGTFKKINWDIIFDDNDNSFYVKPNENEDYAELLKIGEPIKVIDSDGKLIFGVKVDLQLVFTFLKSRNINPQNIIVSIKLSSSAMDSDKNIYFFTKESQYDTSNCFSKIQENLNILTTDTELKSFTSIDNFVSSIIGNNDIFSYNKNNLLYNIDTVIMYYLKYYLINVEFTKNNTLINSENELTDLYEREKRSYGTEESYYLDQKYNIHILSFENIVMTSDSILYKNWEKLYNLETGNDFDSSDSTYIIGSLSVIYKEFNSEIRKIDHSNIQNKIIAKYLLEESSNNTNKNIITNTLFEVAYNAKPNFLLTDDEIKVFNNLKTNDYIIRYGRESDLISYLSGDIIQFGNTEDTKQEVELLCNLYRETRDYYYRVLLNKSFVLDDMYSTFERMYLLGYTIERFISSKLDHITDINYFNNTDCSNFLNSYGLSTLNTQINNNNFSNSLTYKKRIIAAYNDLMSQKGSRAVIDEFFKIFNYQENEITIYKYLILNQTNSVVSDDISQPETESVTSEPVFLRLPYSATNIHYYINNFIKDSTAYESFIENDKYWTVKDLPKSEVEKVLVSPQNTKYLGLELTSNLYNNFIKTRYSVAANKYLFDSDVQDISYNIGKTNIYNKLLISGVVINNTEFSDVSIILLYLYLCELFKLLIYLNESNSGQEVPELSSDPNPKYFGINSDIIIDNTFITELSNKIELSEEIIRDVLSASYLDNTTRSALSTSIYGTYKNTTFFNKSTVDGTNIFPVTSTRIISDGATAVSFKNASSIDTIFNSDSVFLYKFNNTTDFNKSYGYTELEDNCRELLHTPADPEKNQTSLDAISCALISISLVNLINNYRAASTDSDKEKYKKLILAAYRLYKNNDQIEYKSDSNISSDEISINNNNFYSYLYSKILSFPLNYLGDEYQNNSGINYTENIRNTLDYIFNKFFTVSVDPIGRFSASDDIAETIKNNLSTQLSSKINNLDENILSDIEKEVTSITEIINVNDKLTALQNLIINYSSILNSALDTFENMKINFSISNDINNFFEFIKTSVSFFISYTANLYDTNLIYSYDSKAEHIPLAYSFSDQLENKINDYFYYDYSVSIEEIG